MRPVLRRAVVKRLSGFAERRATPAPILRTYRMFRTLGDRRLENTEAIMMVSTDRLELESLKLACNRLLAEHELGGEAYFDHMDLHKVAWARKLLNRILADIEEARVRSMAA